MWKRGFLNYFYNHTTLIAVLVGPLTLMTCGLLVLLTLLDEVSLCTNSRLMLSTFQSIMDNGIWLLGSEFYVILQKK